MLFYHTHYVLSSTVAFTMTKMLPKAELNRSSLQLSSGGISIQRWKAWGSKTTHCLFPLRLDWGLSPAENLKWFHHLWSTPWRYYWLLCIQLNLYLFQSDIRYQQPGLWNFIQNRNPPGWWKPELLRRPDIIVYQPLEAQSAKVLSLYYGKIKAYPDCGFLWNPKKMHFPWGFLLLTSAFPHLSVIGEA